MPCLHVAMVLQKKKGFEEVALTTLLTHCGACQKIARGWNILAHKNYGSFALFPLLIYLAGVGVQGPLLPIYYASVLNFAHSKGR